MLTCVDRKGEKEDVGGQAMGLKMWQLILSMRPARARVRLHVQRAIFPSKRVIFILICKSPHMHKKSCTCILCRVPKICYLLCRLKIKMWWRYRTYIYSWLIRTYNCEQFQLLGKVEVELEVETESETRKESW
jgi:hypothetical protein